MKTSTLLLGMMLFCSTAMAQINDKITTLSQVTSSQAGRLFATCENISVKVEIRKKNNNFYLEILGMSEKTPLTNEWQGKRFTFSSEAKLSQISSGVIKGCFQFDSVKNDPSARPSKEPLWYMFVCIKAETGLDVALFDATQFQPTNSRLNCTPGLFKKLKREISRL